MNTANTTFLYIGAAILGFVEAIVTLIIDNADGLVVWVGPGDIFHMWSLIMDIATLAIATLMWAAGWVGGDWVVASLIAGLVELVSVFFLSYVLPLLGIY